MSAEGNYVDQDYLEQLEINLGTLEEEAIEAIILEVEALVDRLTGNRFTPLTQTVYLSGNGKDVLLFAPEMPYKARSITSVSIWDRSLGSSVEGLEEVTDYALLGNKSGLFRTDGCTWDEGRENICVSGSWGMDSVPLPIKWAVAMMVAQRIDPSYKALYQATSIQWSDYRETRQLARGGIAALTGMPIVDLILRQYKNSIMNFGAP